MFLNFSSIPAGYPAIHIQRRYEGTSVAYLAADGASGSAVASGSTVALLHQEKCSHACAFLSFLPFALHFHYTFALATVKITICTPYYIYKLVMFKKGRDARV